MRLDFRLPAFARQAWVSDAARAAWEERLDSVARCWPRIERAAVAAGMRRCALAEFSPGELDYMRAEAASDDLACAVLAEAPAGWLTAVIGVAADATLFGQRWRRGDHAGMGALLGYPACCRRFYADVLAVEGWIDPVWPMAANSRGATPIAPDGRIAGGVAVGGRPAANLLLRRLGLAAVPHLPCAWDCAPTQAQAEEYRRLGIDSGFAEAMASLHAILDWPMEWSALHGIAEVRTPVFKLAMDTDASAATYIVRHHGRSYPEHGATGLVFPYRRPDRLVVSESRGFQEGLVASSDR